MPEPPELPPIDPAVARGRAGSDGRSGTAPEGRGRLHYDVLLPEEPSLRDYLEVLYYRRWAALTAFAATMVVTAVWTFTQTPQYEATVKVLIEAETPKVVTFEDVIQEAQQRNDYYQTQYDLLKSRSLARRTLDGLRLWTHPQFAGEGAGEGFGLRRLVTGAWSAVAGLFGSGHAEEGGAGAPEETAAQARAVDAFLKALTVTPVRNSRIVDVKFRSPDPVLAAKVADAHARNYIEQNLEYRFLASKEATDWLAARLAEQRRKLEESEAALQRYREVNDAVSVEDRQNIVVQKLADLNAAVTRAKTERIEKEALYAQLRAIQSDRAALDTFPAILTNTFIQQQKAELAELQREEAQLAEKLGDRHPNMIKVRSAIQAAQTRLQAEIAKVVQAVRNEYQAALARERSLTEALEAQKREALALNRKAIEYGVLQRDVESNRQIYESLLQRAKETGVAGELKASNIRIVDAAEVPRRPVLPRKGLNLLIGGFLGLMLGVGVAFFFEHLDNRIKSPEEIKTALGLPFFGFVPLVSPEEYRGAAPLLLDSVPPRFSEALRAVRTNVLFATAEEGCKVLAVASSQPGEGKTVTAANLAVGLAQAGHRVLLVDADLRKPRAHELFGLTLEPGLSNVLVGNAKANDAVRKGPVAGLWVLPAGRVPPNAAELLGSPRFAEFLGTLREHFEWIVLDTAPVLAVADAAVVAHGATGVLFVVGCDMTSRPAAEAALERLDAARARVVGAVLNRVDLDGQPYYYSQYYRREYAHYYGAGRRS
ncbi:MAG TPA: polysaccharide biosynthesis tyrosine autokinase [Vicinamibacterales bacterium]|nr:polysaccharide biosynthesis tyrosine autokinase [Vicinamibacterales bacterium]